MISRRSAICAVAFLAFAAAILSGGQYAKAQTVLMMPDSTNNRLVYFSPVDGSVVNPNAFPLAAGTPIHALQVGSEIWVSEQIGDRLSRWDFNGNSLGAVTGGLDNLRGMALIQGAVYVCNDGTANGAGGASIHKFDMSGGSHTSWPTPFSSPFGILEYPGGMLVSSDAANDDIHKYSLSGTSLGTFNNSALSFLEQMDYATNGDVLVAVFSSNVVARLDPTTGAQISTFAASGARGVQQLSNGNIMWTNSAGAHVYNVGTGVSTQVYSGGGRYLDLLVIPEPGSLALFGLGAAIGLVRRRRSR